MATIHVSISFRMYGPHVSQSRNKLRAYEMVGRRDNNIQVEEQPHPFTYTYMYTYTYKYKIQISYKYTCIADNRTNILNEVLVGFYIVINGRAQLKVIICLCLKQLPSLEPFILKYPLNSQALSSKTYIGNISICKKEQEYP